MSHNSLANYLETMFALRQHHQWSIADIENLYPWERDLYIKMLTDYLEEKREKQRQAERERQGF